jgi:hypothetical protein
MGPSVSNEKGLEKTDRDRVSVYEIQSLIYSLLNSYCPSGSEDSDSFMTFRQANHVRANIELIENKLGQPFERFSGKRLNDELAKERANTFSVRVQ